MKRIAAIILALALMCGLAACGKDDTQDTNSGQSSQTDVSSVSSAESDIASFKYHQMLENDDSKYYYEANVVEEYLEDELTEEYLKGEARDGKGNYVLLTGEEELDVREIQTKDAYYSVYDSEKEYAKDEGNFFEEEGDDSSGEDDLNLTYVKSDQMKMDGKTYDYDEYRGNYEFEGYTEDDKVVMEQYRFIKRYLMDKKGKLYAIEERQAKIGTEGKKDQLIYKRVEKITKFQEGKFPKNVFKIPEDYEETADFPEEELLIEE